MSKDNKDHDDVNQDGAPEPGRPSRRPWLSDDAVVAASAPAVALGMLYVEAAWSLSMGMQNAVVAQQAAWRMQNASTARAVDLLLRNDVVPRAADIVLDDTNVAVAARSAAAPAKPGCPNGC